jgi:hypothetical protein
MTLATQAGGFNKNTIETVVAMLTFSNAAQISGLGSIRDCERLAKQKQLTSNHYYCIQTGKPFDRNFEKRNNWK